MTTVPTIALPASTHVDVGSPMRRLTHALRSLRLRLGVQASGPEVMVLDPQELTHERRPEDPAEAIRREAVDRVFAACPYLR